MQKGFAVHNCTMMVEHKLGVLPTEHLHLLCHPLLPVFRVVPQTFLKPLSMISKFDSCKN